MEINHISVRVGDNVEIKCDVTGSPPPPLVWRRNDADLETLGEQEVRIHIYRQNSPVIKRYDYFLVSNRYAYSTMEVSISPESSSFTLAITPVTLSETRTSFKLTFSPYTVSPLHIQTKIPSFNPSTRKSKNKSCKCFPHPIQK